MGKAKKYCEGCGYYDPTQRVTNDRCTFSIGNKDTPFRRELARGDPWVQNAKNDCKFYKEKGAFL